MIEDQLLLFMRTDPVLIPVIGERIFPDEAPAQITGPYIIWHSANMEFISVLEGETDLETKSFDFVAYSIQKLQAVQMADRIARIFARDTYVQTRGIYLETKTKIECCKSSIGFGGKASSVMATSEPEFYIPVSVQCWYKVLE